MCQATVFVARDGEMEEVMRDVISLKAEEGSVTIQSFFDPPQSLHARVRTIDFLKHTVTLEPTEKEGEPT
jgi:predicted RNA-binding protein